MEAKINIIVYLLTLALAWWLGKLYCMHKYLHIVKDVNTQFQRYKDQLQTAVENLDNEYEKSKLTPEEKKFTAISLYSTTIRLGSTKFDMSCFIAQKLEIEKELLECADKYESLLSHFKEQPKTKTV